MLRRWGFAVVLVGSAAAAVATGLPTLAEAGKSARPKMPGNPSAGRSIFVSTCGVCHTLAAADTAGVVGPNLDRVRLTRPLIVRAVTSGGSTVMAPAAAARYGATMPAYRHALSKRQIQDVAAFVYASTHP